MVTRRTKLSSHEPPLLMYHNFGVYTLHTLAFTYLYTYNESSTVSYTKHFCYQYRIIICPFSPVILKIKNKKRQELGGRREKQQAYSKKIKECERGRYRF